MPAEKSYKWTSSETVGPADDILDAIFRTAPVALVLVARHGTIELANEEAEKLFGYSSGEMIGQPIELLVPARSRVDHVGERSKFLASPQTRYMGVSRALFALRKDGGEIPIEIALKSLETSSGVFVMAVVVDLTERKYLERRFEIAIEAAPIAMLMLDAEGRMTLVNRQAEKLYGYSRAELLGEPVEMLLPPEYRPRDVRQREEFLRAATPQRLGSPLRELSGLRKDGTQFPIEAGLTPVVSGTGALKLVTIVDVSASRQAQAVRERASEELEQRVRERTAELALANLENEALLATLQAKSAELERLSREDPLTRLANRRDFDERLAHEIRRAGRLGTSLAMAMIDLDYFKRVNDRFGHVIGDAVLREAANLVRQECRAIDLIGRYGGEEFALALPGCDLCAGIAVCERIRRAFERFDWDRIAPGLKLTVSAGVSASSTELDAAALLRAADANLYAAKHLGRNRVVPELPAVAPT
jgi:diguanylate cyclase (GGDEF)-like protein/PAS domain S-box-containing protein